MEVLSDENHALSNLEGEFRFDLIFWFFEFFSKEKDMKYSTSYGLAFGLHGVTAAFYIVAGFLGPMITS